MKAIAKLIAIAILLPILITMNGCEERLMRKKYTPKEKKEMALQYMKDKYNEDFIGVSWGPSEPMQPYDRFKVYPASKTEDELILIEGDYEEDGRYTFQDSYFEILIEDRYKKYIDDIVKEIYPTYYLKVKIRFFKTYPSRLTEDIPINQIFLPGEENWTNFGSHIELAIPESLLQGESIKRHAYRLRDTLLKNNLSCQIYFYVIKEDKYQEYVDKKGEVYPTDPALEHVDRREEKEKLIAGIEEEFFIRQGKMKKVYYEISTSPKEDYSGLKTYDYVEGE